MPFEFGKPTSVSFFSSDGSLVGNMEDITEFEPETTLSEEKDSDIRTVDFNKEITFTAPLSPCSLKKIEKIAYDWKCSGPIRKRVWYKLFITKCRNNIRKEMINRVNQRSTF